MKIYPVILLAVCLFSFSAQTHAQRFIRSIAVELNTTDDDKDNDTYLECKVLASDNSWLAATSGQFGLFPDHTSYTLYLNMGSPNYPEAFLSPSTLYMRIAPHGRDTWHFNWCVVVSYSDGNQSRICGTGSLNEDATWFRLPLFR